ncbi:unnamed protein product [Hyaloperonospora brassicae]|uniref:Rab3 GTPase-activating protein catalytic subunit n=1 Tax=Hyaloperonospora brassicae TaxID=162125 RepID=A0AAV0UGZ3_HYABA|nr:unnamed protein product [Hyaloperonospora brassicae]
MQVEEDPSSQFIDFTNATAMEQFTSDIEQAIIGWRLDGKSHVSLEALSVPPQAGHQLEALNAAIWTKELYLQPPGKDLLKSYTLTLFASRHQSMQQKGENASACALTSTKKHKTWQEGLEHFTPTMLSVANASEDFHWGLEQSDGVEEEEEGATVSSYASMYKGDREPHLSRKMTYDNAHKWFGVDEFLLLTRSSLREIKKEAEKDGNETDEAKESILHVKGRIQRQGIEDVAEQKGDDDSHQDMFAMEDVHIDQTEGRMLLSALHVALNNCNCTIPAFVPMFEPSRGTWIGSAVPGATGNVSMSFETDSIPEINPNQSCISGLLDFFKVKLQLSPHAEQKCRVQADALGDLAIGTKVSASFTYSWNRVDDPREKPGSEKHQAWRTLESQQPPSIQHHICHITNKLFGKKRPSPFMGAATTPLDGMDLTVCWPQLREGTYVDNVVHSTLDLSSASQWMLSVRFQDLLSENQYKPHLPLSKQMANLVQIYSNSRGLNRDISVGELAPPMTPFSPRSKSLTGTTMLSSDVAATALRQPHSSNIPNSIPAARAAVVLGNAISSLVSVTTWKNSDGAEIRRIISDLFDDVQDGGEQHTDQMIEKSDEQIGRSRTALASMTSSIQHGAPLGELVSILATRMSQLPSINSMSLLWIEFVKALRERWFQQQLLPFMDTGLGSGGVDCKTGSRSLDTLFLLSSDSIRLPLPDFRQCLLHQKLQLLNWCILSKSQEVKSTFTGSIDPDHEIQLNSDAKGFTSDKDLAYEMARKADDELDSSPSDEEFFDSIEHKTNEPLLEPVTRTSMPITEDVAKEQQDLITRLNASVEFDKTRQQIQSAALISDMQAFKAANPRCCLADFIRWYSPKDWISFESKKDPTLSNLPTEGQGVWWFDGQGMLSKRMRFGSGHEHEWQKMWETSAPIPLKRQKRSFDPVQESEKVYHYMETLPPCELFHQMLAAAIPGCVFALETALPVHVSAQNLPVVHRALRKLCLRGNRAIALLDEALAESQVTPPLINSRKQQSGNSHEPTKGATHQGRQLQVAFEMALDACWELVRTIESVEALVSKALALLRYFPVSKEDQSSLALINLLLLPSRSHRHQVRISELLKQDNLRQLVTALVLTGSTLTDAQPKPVPIKREYVLRCICPRPYLRDYYGALATDDNDDEAMETQSENELGESPLVVCRMYAAFETSTVRFALVLAESEF